MAERSRPNGLSNTMERTRSAIVAAARDLADTGAEITTPAVAAEARVSEATAYRYFPDLLLRAAVMTEDLVAVLRSATRGDDPVERIGQAAEILGRAVLRRQGAVRVVVASTIAKPSTSDPNTAGSAGSMPISARRSPPDATARARSKGIFPGSWTAQGFRRGASAADIVWSRPVLRTVSGSRAAPACVTTCRPSRPTRTRGYDETGSLGWEAYFPLQPTGPSASPVLAAQGHCPCF
ncbi:TetR family transcriptional regulator [Streptomyces sp. Ag109_O5-1]|nr:TetR family transcriptional regulator [Streptomyces sp. Ag109_O5-1]